MKLMLVISTLGTGGAERVLSQLANSWVEIGHQVTLLTTHAGAEAPYYRLDKRIRLNPGNLGPRKGSGVVANLGRLSVIRSAAKDLRPDIIISFLNYTNILVLLATIGMKIPVVVSERLDPRVHRLGVLWNSLRRVLYGRAACLVNQTESAAVWFRPWLGARVRVVPNPVLLPSYSTSEPELTVGPRTILAMGRLHSQKGFPTLLAAMKVVHERYPDWRLMVLGEGPERGALEKLRRELALDGVVKFPGRVRNPHDVLVQGQMFVMSSVTEGFPNVLGEAMANGLPVIATDCPSGPAELIENHRNGILVPVGGVQEMAAAMMSLIENRDLRQRLGAESAQVCVTYSLDSILAAWDLILRKPRA